jgi:hypothetical protein
VDISNWRITHGDQNFVLPKNTIILKNQKVSYSPKITKFTDAESLDFALYNAGADLIFDYEANTVHKKVSAKSFKTKLSSAKDTELVTEYTSGLSANLNENNNSVGESLTARATASLPQGYNKNFFAYGLGLVLLLGVSSSSVYLLRKGQRSGSRDDDFEVFDE